MPKANLADIVRRCQRLLRPETFTDWDGAVNGLQVENSGTVTRIAAAVDASLATIKLAVAAQADLADRASRLVLGADRSVDRSRREMLDLLIRNDLAVYSSHLPLDAHPRLGNNAQLCAALGFKKLQPFLLRKRPGHRLANADEISRRGLGAKLGAVLGRAPIILPGGPSDCDESASSRAARAAN